MAKEQKYIIGLDIAKREEPKDFATQLTKHTKLGNFYNTSPSISPQGNKNCFHLGHGRIFGCLLNGFAYRKIKNC